MTNPAADSRSLRALAALDAFAGYLDSEDDPMPLARDDASEQRRLAAGHAAARAARTRRLTLA